jgi:hypothetical protein
MVLNGERIVRSWHATDNGKIPLQERRSIMKQVILGIVAVVLLAGWLASPSRTPYKYYKVYGLGDMYAPKHATAQVEHRYQSVRIIAVYDTGQLQAPPAGGPPSRG